LKRYNLFLLFLSIVFTNCSKNELQVCNYDWIEGFAIQIDELDLEYQKIYLNNNSKDCDSLAKKIFHDYSKKFIQHIADDFVWEEVVKCHVKIYFSKNGKAEYFIYKFDELKNQLDDDSLKLFERLSIEFIKKNPLEIHKDKPYSLSTYIFLRNI